MEPRARVCVVKSVPLGKLTIPLVELCLHSGALPVPVHLLTDPPNALPARLLLLRPCLTPVPCPGRWDILPSLPGSGTVLHPRDRKPRWILASSCCAVGAACRAAGLGAKGSWWAPAFVARPQIGHLRGWQWRALSTAWNWGPRPGCLSQASEDGLAARSSLVLKL